MKLAIACGLVAAFIAGCATSPGASEAQTPPKLVASKDGNIWDNPAAFGPVPSDKMAAGVKACSPFNKDGVQYVATGYHHAAIGIDGKPFVGGGFYCVPK